MTLKERREYEENIKRPARLKRYLQLIGKDNIELPLLEEDIDRDAFARVCVESCTDRKRFLRELTQ